MNLQAALDHRARVEDFLRTHRTGLVTMLFTDLVGSTRLKQDLGDRTAVAAMQAHHAALREILADFKDAEEISTSGDSFFIVFAKPSDAVRFALRIQSRTRQDTKPELPRLQDRIGIHIGEVIIEERNGAPKPKDFFGIQVDLCARVMSLAEGDQILMTRSSFDNARQALKGEDLPGLGGLGWLSHGPYSLKGVEEPVEICEVGEKDFARLAPPGDSEKAHRHVSPGAEPVLGWRPALGQMVPGTNWVLEQKLGEGGFGEVWLAQQTHLKERRVFKFCFRADRVRSLRREVTLFRLLRERAGSHPNIVSVQDVFFDTPPYYLMMEYAEGGDLKTWCAAKGGALAVPLATRLEIAAQIAEALRVAHGVGILHRDVKPTNILVSELADGKVLARLTDFGIGQVMAKECLAGVTQAGFTQTLMGSTTSSQGGSQLYMAPELLAGGNATLGADVYALGVVIIQLIVGDFRQPLTQDWARLVPDPLLRRLLEPMFVGNPHERPADCGQVARELRAWDARQKALALQAESFRKHDQWRFRVTQIAGIALILFGLGSGLNGQPGGGLAAIGLGVAGCWCAHTRYRGGTPSVLGGLLAAVGIGAFLSALPMGALINPGAWLILAFFLGIAGLLLSAGHKIHGLETQRLRDEFGELLINRSSASPPISRPKTPPVIDPRNPSPG